MSFLEFVLPGVIGYALIPPAKSSDGYEMLSIRKLIKDLLSTVFTGGGGGSSHRHVPGMSPDSTLLEGKQVFSISSIFTF